MRKISSLLLLLLPLIGCQKESIAPDGMTVAAAAVAKNNIPADPEPDPYGPVISFEIGVFYPDGQPVANHPVKVEKLNCEYDFTPAAVWYYTGSTGTVTISGSLGMWQFYAWNSGNRHQLDYRCLNVTEKGNYQIYLTVDRPIP